MGEFAVESPEVGGKNTGIWVDVSISVRNVIHGVSRA